MVVLAWTVLGALLLAPGAPSAGESPVGGEVPMAGGAPMAGPCRLRVASVESRVSPQELETKDPARVLRHDLEGRLGRIDCRRERIDRSYDVLAEIADVESTNGRGKVTTSITVKAIVRDGSGSLLAVVVGKAKGEDRSSARAALEREVLEAASARASSSVPEAIRRARGTK